MKRIGKTFPLRKLTEIKWEPYAFRSAAKTFSEFGMNQNCSNFKAFKYLSHKPTHTNTHPHTQILISPSSTGSEPENGSSPQHMKLVKGRKRKNEEGTLFVACHTSVACLLLPPP